MRITRQALYDLVWSTPTSVAAKELEISDVGLAKICRAANVPIPHRGYWAKKQAGKPVLQPSLPPRGFGQIDDVEVGRGYSPAGPSDSEVLGNPLPQRPEFAGGAADLRKQVEDLVQRVAIPKSLKEPHHVIAKLLANDEVRRQKLLASPYASWHAPFFDSRIEKRRLRILNALFHWAARNDFSCGTDGKQARGASIVVGNRAVSFSLDAVGADHDYHHERASPIADDAKLALKLTWWEPPPEVRAEWRDNDDKSLEEQLVEIAREIVFAAEWGYRRAAIDGHERLVKRRADLEHAAIEQQAAEVRKEEERLEGLLQERRDALWREVAAWRKAEDLRAYVRAAQAMNHARDAWAKWALGEADLVDPILSTCEQ